MLEMLRDIPLFSGLNNNYLHKIVEECTVSNYSAGTLLFRENEVGTVLYLIVSGAVKIYSSNANGEDKILSIMSKGDCFGELSLLDGKPRSATAQVIEDTKVLTLSSKSFHSLLQYNFEMALHIIKDLSARLRETNQQVHDLTYLDARKRVIKNLVKLANDYGTRNGNYVRFKINLNYDDIAQMAGVTKPLLFQVFNELQMKGILAVSTSEFVLHLSKMKL